MLIKSTLFKNKTLRRLLSKLTLARSHILTNLPRLPLIQPSPTNFSWTWIKLWTSHCKRVAMSQSIICTNKDLRSQKHQLEVILSTSRTWDMKVNFTSVTQLKRCKSFSTLVLQLLGFTLKNVRTTIALFKTKSTSNPNLVSSIITIKLDKSSNTEEVLFLDTHLLIDSASPKAKITASTTSLSWLLLRPLISALWKDLDLLVLLHPQPQRKTLMILSMLVYQASFPNLKPIRTSTRISNQCSVSTFPTTNQSQVRWSLVVMTLLSSPNKELKTQIFSGLTSLRTINTGLLIQRTSKLEKVVPLSPATINNLLSIMVWVSALFQTNLSLTFWNTWKKSMVLVAKIISHSGLAQSPRNNIWSFQIWNSTLLPILKDRPNTSKCLSTLTWNLMEEHQIKHGSPFLHLMISVLLEITKRNIGCSEPNFCRTTIVFSTSKQRELDLSNLNQQCLKSMPIQLSSEIESHYVSKLRT